MQQPLQRILEKIQTLGLNDNLRELEAQGYTTLPNVLSKGQIERAKRAIVARVERTTSREVAPDASVAGVVTVFTMPDMVTRPSSGA